MSRAQGIAPTKNRRLYRNGPVWYHSGILLSEWGMRWFVSSYCRETDPAMNKIMSSPTSSIIWTSVEANSVQAYTCPFCCCWTWPPNIGGCWEELATVLLWDIATTSRGCASTRVDIVQVWRGISWYRSSQRVITAHALDSRYAIGHVIWPMWQK